MTQLLEVNDIVEACGTRFIIVSVHPNRPANPYVAIKERGNGAKYKLGHKHHPHKVGTISNDHRLFEVLVARDLGRLGDGATAMVKELVMAVITDDDSAREKAMNILPLLS